MALFPKSAPIAPVMISTFSARSVGRELGAMAASFSANGTAWNSANQGFFYPLRLEEPFLVAKTFFVTGSVQVTPGAADVGVFLPNGTKVVSSGAVTLTTSNTLQESDVTDTWLPAGLYYLGMSCDSTNPRFANNLPTTMLGKSWGIMQASTVHPLPATVTFAALTTNTCPLFGISQRTLVA